LKSYPEDYVLKGYLKILKEMGIESAYINTNDGLIYPFSNASEEKELSVLNKEQVLKVAILSFKDYLK
jgi:hypothetical protein